MTCAECEVDKGGSWFRCEVANGVTKYLFFCFDCYKAAAAIAMGRHDRATKYNRRRNWGSDYYAFHHSCLDSRMVDMTDRSKQPDYRPSRREYYREYMRKRRANEATHH